MNIDNINNKAASDPLRSYLGVNLVKFHVILVIKTDDDAIYYCGSCRLKFFFR